MRKLGLICNPRSLRNRKDPALATMASKLPFAFAQPDDPAELTDVMADFVRRGVDLVGIAGGDGTIREVMTAISRTDGYRPDLALIPSGKTNLAAQAFGVDSIGLKALANLIDGLRTGEMRRIEAPVIDVSWQDESRQPVRGLLFGAGAFRAASDLANRKVHRFGINDGQAIAVTLGLTVFALLFRGAPHLRKGDEIALSFDGEAPSASARFLLLVSSLQQFLPRIDPFWGEGEGALRWLDIDAPPRRLLRALFPTISGRPQPWMERAGYRSGRAHRMQIRMDAPFILDGEAFEAGPNGITLSADNRVAFIMP